MAEEKILMIRMKERENNDIKIKGSSIFDAHYHHAMVNKGRLWFVKKTQKEGTKGALSKTATLLVLALSSKKQLIGEIVDRGRIGENNPKDPNNYTMPSLWDEKELKDGYPWYTLDNVELLDADKDFESYSKIWDNFKYISGNGTYRDFEEVFGDSHRFKGLVHFSKIKKD